MKKIRVVVYIRVSTASDAQLHSYEFQEEYWRRVFENNPEYEFVGIYADKGISGRSIQKRPQFLSMMEDAREHKFDKIYTKSVSRFARNTLNLLEAVRELRDLGIEVVFESENIHTFNPGSELYMTIAATIAENDLSVDSERMRWSIKHRYENGWIDIGSGLFGYRMEAGNTLAIVPEEAETVRYIFNEYTAGQSSRKIAKSVNDKGIKTREGRTWMPRHVMEIIKNEKYKGDAIMGKSTHINGIRYRNNGAKLATQYNVEDSHPGIVTREQWDMAQKIREARVRQEAKKNPVYPFTGLIECGECGEKFRHKVNNTNKPWRTDIWVCGFKYEYGKSVCGNSSIKNSVLEEKFVECYNEFVTQRPDGDTVQVLQEILKSIRQEERSIGELRMKGLISAEVFSEEKRRISTRCRIINDKIAEQRSKNISESDYNTITEFSPEKVLKFIQKVIVSSYTVTFVFYNGVRMSREYTNGNPGNKKGWKTERKKS